jgi:hypothetical protein
VLKNNCVGVTPDNVTSIDRVIEFDNPTYDDGRLLLKKKYEDVLTNVLKMFL